MNEGTDENDFIEKFYKVASAHVQKRYAEVKDKGLKMAHYTTAESAALILRNKTLWLRNAALMNDFSEISYGTTCLEIALESGLEQRLESAIATVYPELFPEVRKWLRTMAGVTQQQTYLISLAAHHPDDHLGKLSMWRAYGGTTAGVAIVFNTEAFEHDSSELEAYSSPVLYGDWKDLSVEIEIFISEIENNLHIHS